MITAKAGRKPAYQKIADDLLAAIVDGSVQPGERLPKEQELCRLYGTTRTTVRQAYKVLVEGQWVVSRGSAGYFVRLVRQRTLPLIQNGRFTDPWSFLRSQGRPTEAVTVHVDGVDKQIRGRRLGDLLPGVPRLARRRVLRYLDGEPVELTDVYAPFAQVADTSFMDPEESAAGLLAGANITGSIDVIGFRVPTPAEVDALELPEATGVAEALRWIRIDNAPGLVVHSVFRADEAEFELDFPQT